MRREGEGEMEMEWEGEGERKIRKEVRERWSRRDGVIG